MTTGNEQSKASWWREGLRVLQFNWSSEEMHDLDVDVLTEVCLDAKANAVVIPCGGIYAWYPTEVPFHHAEPEARARDPFGRCFAACKTAALRVIARVDFSRNAAGAYEEHPDWFARNASGKEQVSQSSYVTCCSSPYRNGAYAEQVLREIADRYDIDGFHVNAGGFRGLCYCTYCQSSFNDYADADIPTVPDWDDPLWIRFLSWRKGAVAANIAYLGDVIRSMGRDLFFMGELMGPGRLSYGSAMYPRELAGKFSALLLTTGEGIPTEIAKHSPWWVGMSAKCAQPYLPDVQPVINLKAFLREADWPRIAVPTAAYRFQIWQALANNAGLKLPVLGSLKREDRGTLPAVQRGFDRAARIDRELEDLSPLADVALVWPVRTALLYGRENFEERVNSHFYGAYNLLVQAHIPFVVLDEESLAERDLSAYRAVVLPNVATLSSRECSALEKYVADGGGLVASFDTGHFDADAPTCMSTALDLLLGVNRSSREPVDRGKGYGRVERLHPISTTTEAELVPHVGSFVRCSLDAGTTPIMHFAEPRDIGGSFEQWEAPSSTDEVLATVRFHGRGRVAYFANKIDSVYWESPHADCRALFAGAVRWAAGDRALYRTSARSSVEITLYRTKDEVVVHLVNGTGATEDGQEAQQLTDVEIALDLGSFPTPSPSEVDRLSATALFGGIVDVSRVDHEVQLKLDTLHELETILVRGMI